MRFQPGDVLEVTWDDRPIRVIMGDQFEVFYEVLLPEVGWSLARARTAIYYRVATDFLGTTAQRIRTELLSEKELARHRPDLPMRMLRSAQANWRRPLPDWPKIDTGFEVQAERLALVPFGPKGAPQKPVVIEAANGRSITGPDLLAAAQRAQTADDPDVHGVGLYRSGITGGIPSYYLWGEVDAAGNAGQLGA